MISVRQIDTRSKSDVQQFVQLPYRLYRDCPQWVPPPLIDAKAYLNKEKHPFYEHSDGDFFIAEAGDQGADDQCRPKIPDFDCLVGRKTRCNEERDKRLHEVQDGFARFVIESRPRPIDLRDENGTR